MSDPNEPPLPLRAALELWCDPTLVEGVRARERELTEHEMSLVTERPRLVTTAELTQPAADQWMKAPPDCSRLMAAWRALEADLRDRLIREHFFLRGVMTRPTLATEAVPIPPAWAADAEFDFVSNSVSVNDTRFSGVMASRAAPEASLRAPVGSGGASLDPPARPDAPAPITMETVRSLTDDEVLTLLEDHARRVVENPDYPALDSGITKVSFMPLILRMMRARAASGELMPTLAGEAAALEKWIQQKAPSHQCPTAGAIENSLRDHYWQLKA